jgi:hypothetical protein
MKLCGLWRRKPLILFSSVCAMHLLTTLVVSEAAVNSSDARQSPSRDQLRLAQQGECSERAGPFATQATAWQRWRQVQGQGYALSQGIFPCTDQSGARGYCFNVFYRC